MTDGTDPSPDEISAEPTQTLAILMEPLLGRHFENKASGVRAEVAGWTVVEDQRPTRRARLRADANGHAARRGAVYLDTNRGKRLLATLDTLARRWVEVKG